MDTARTMGAALLIFGVALAATAGSTGEPVLLAAGIVGAALLLYLGIGLYSRSLTGEERLHEVDEDSRSAFVDSTAYYVAAAAAVVGFLGFAAASATGAGPLPLLVFGGVFLYSLAAAVWIRRRREEDDEDASDVA